MTTTRIIDVIPGDVQEDRLDRDRFEGRWVGDEIGEVDGGAGGVVVKGLDERFVGRGSGGRCGSRDVFEEVNEGVLAREGGLEERVQRLSGCWVDNQGWWGGGG